MANLEKFNIKKYYIHLYTNVLNYEDTYFSNTSITS